MESRKLKVIECPASFVEEEEEEEEKRDGW